ncbi:MAG: hypothetical protein ACKVIY_07805 [Acidimicrobiales bacterium]
MAEFHVAAVVHSATGKLLGTERFDATPSGYEALLAWMASGGTIDGVDIEGTGAYGAGLARIAKLDDDRERPTRSTRSKRPALCCPNALLRCRNRDRFG